MIYVDNANIRKGKDVWCHLMSDQDDRDQEIHQFAEKIELRKWWFHRDHYDVCSSMRRKAVAAGAVETTMEHLVQIRQQKREAEQQNNAEK